MDAKMGAQGFLFVLFVLGVTALVPIYEFYLQIRSRLSAAADRFS